MKKIIITIATILSLTGIVGVAHSQSVFKGIQGGTGISSTVIGNIGSCLKVSSVNPLIWEIGSCGSGGSVTWLANGGAFFSSSTVNFQAGSNITITTSTDGTYTITGSAGGSGTVSTSSQVSLLHFPYWATASTLSGTSTLTISGTAINNSGTISVSGVPVALSNITITGTGFLDGGGDLTANRTINFSAATITSSTRWDAAWASSSLAHSAVTLSGTPDYITLNGQDIVRGTVDISDDTNLSVISPLTKATDTIWWNFGVGNTWTATQAFSVVTNLTGFTNSGNGTTTNLTITGLTDALILGGANGALAEYAGDTEACSGSDQMTSITLSATGTLTITCSAQGSGGGITSLNGQTGSSQIFSTSTGGTDPWDITSAGDVHTLRFPTSSATRTGLLSSSDWTIFNTKLSTSTGLTSANFATTSVGQWANNDLYIVSSTYWALTPQGDLGGTWDNPSVDDDSHAHTGATISGLAVGDFTSANISQWTNDSGYITIAGVSSTLKVGSAATSTGITGLVFQTSTIAGTWDVRLTGGNILTFSIPPASDAYFAPSTTIPIAANPTASVGLTANNGTANTFMRSDASPALSQAIAPTWTGLHIFQTTTTFNATVKFASSTASRCARFDANQNLVAASGDCTAGDTTGSGGGVATSSNGVYAQNNLAFFVNSSTISASSGLTYNSSTGLFQNFKISSSTELISPSSTLTTLFGTNLTFTNGTTTNIRFTNATGTAFFSTTGIFTNFTATNATTTNFAASTIAIMPINQALTAQGQVSVKTTSSTLNFHDGTAERVLQPEQCDIDFVLENPSSAEDDYIRTFHHTSTITQLYSHHRDTMSSTTFNIIWGNGTLASSSARHLFTNNVTSTASSTAIADSYPSLVAFASTTVDKGMTMRLITSLASSSQWGLTICYRVQP